MKYGVRRWLMKKPVDIEKLKEDFFGKGGEVEKLRPALVSKLHGFQGDGTQIGKGRGKGSIDKYR